MPPTEDRRRLAARLTLLQVCCTVVFALLTFSFWFLQVVQNAKSIARFEPGSILVTSITDPDWVPIMKRAAAIVTDHGGRTSHAAIVSRELGLPAIVGTGEATHVLHDEQEITVSCAEGDEGFVYEGAAEFEVSEVDPGAIPATRTRIMLNLANPAAAFRW